MKIYKYEFSLFYGCTHIKEFECNEIKTTRGKSYFIRGKGQMVSQKRLDQFKPIKNGLHLICWSFRDDRTNDFKFHCRAKIKKMLYDINEKYTYLITRLNEEIECED